MRLYYEYNINVMISVAANFVLTDRREGDQEDRLYTAKGLYRAFVMYINVRRQSSVQDKHLAKPSYGPSIGVLWEGD